MITDLFSHKIHSSSDNWPEKLIELACIFKEFDGLPYDREAIEKRLSEISPRASLVARDPSKFRDEISAYPAYLGLYRLEIKDSIWVFKLSETAKRFLTNEEPDVASFMILQLCLFQYPNGMGVAYYSNSDKLRIQANTRDRSFDLIKKGIHISPFRLICKALEADSIIRGISTLKAQISYSELFVLANHEETNKKSLPDLKKVIDILKKAREGKLSPPEHFESRFHIVNHTEFIISERGSLKIRPALNEVDEILLLSKFETINKLDLQFNGFDKVKNEEEFVEVIKSGVWGKYFDGYNNLSSEVIYNLTSEYISEIVLKVAEPEIEKIKVKEVELQAFKANTKYPLRKRTQIEDSGKSDFKQTKFTDPEITRIKRQRSNLTHKIILQQLEDYLSSLGAEPLENEHIDLFAKIPNDGKFIFEVKSVSDDNLLPQTRKGISQLYEYRYRYQEEIGYDVKLCLVYPSEPSVIDWLEDYVCVDREIGIIWFNEHGTLSYSNQCRELVRPILK